MFSSIKVSIGIPVYNGTKTIKVAIDSLIKQTHKNIELIISDNNSCDDTFKICSLYAKADERIILFKQNSTLSPADNFKFVFDQSVGEYFMWAAADDYWFPDFIKENLQNLQNKDQFAGSISKVIFKDKSGNIYPSFADSEIAGSTLSRIKFFLNQPGDNSRIYSLFKRDYIKEIKFNNYRFHAADWFFIYKVLLKYRLTSTNEVLMCREKSDEFKYFRTHLEDNSNWITLGLPLFPFTLRVILCTPIFILICIIPELLKLNYRIYNRYRIMRVTKKNV
jgi:glycosyltransferase involved in cell wall biosynthesis